MFFIQMKPTLMPPALALRFFLILVLLFICSLPLWTQIHITGRVLTYDDSSNVQNAVVFLRSSHDSAVLGRTMTDPQGRFSFIINSEQALQAVPEGVELLQNYPNPFIENTTIPFRLHKASNVSVLIYDLFGRLVRTVLSNGLTAGYHVISWDGKTSDGTYVPLGIYFCSITIGGVTKSMTMVRNFSLPGLGDKSPVASRTISRNMLNIRSSIKNVGLALSVIDSNGSMPRFYSRNNLIAISGKDTSIVILVNRIQNANWEFLDYLDIGPPVYECFCTYNRNKQLRYFKPFLYVVGRSGVSRKNVMLANSAWEDIIIQDSTGVKYNNYQYINDILVYNPAFSHDTLFILAGNDWDKQPLPISVLFKSTDAGASWHEAPTKWVMDQIKNIVQTDSFIVAGSPMHYSSDIGVTWSKVHTGSVGGINSIVQNVANRNLLCAAGMFNCSVNVPKFATSTNGGKEWKNITSDISPSFGQDGVSNLAFDSQDSILYAVMYSGTMKIMLNKVQYYPRTRIGEISGDINAQLGAHLIIAGTIIEYAKNYGLRQSTDFGSTWIQINGGPFTQNSWSTNIIFIPEYDSFLIGFESGLWKYKVK